MGERFTVVDAYAWTVLNWLRIFKIDLVPWPKLAAYVERVGSRDSVKQAMAAEKA
jgi:glutathione S-transferase